LRLTSRRIEHACQVVALLATVWFVGVAAWEIAGPFGAGHYAAGPSFAVAAENSLRFRQPGPVPGELLSAPPQPSQIYCHHPWGFYWLMTLFVGVLGHHDWVVRLPAVLLSGATVPLLYAIARLLWSPLSGAACALGFVTLPIALAFCNLGNLEVPTIFSMLAVIWTSLRYHEAPSRPRLGWALASAALACFMDWPAAVFMALWCCALAVRSSWRLAALLGFVAALTLGAQLLWFARLGQLPDLWRSAELRSLGRELPLREVLASRRYWLELSFTWPVMLLGVLMAPVLAGRAVMLRRPNEACVLALLGAALVHYLVFKNGADVHVFWSHYFAPYYALALGALVETLRSLLPRLEAKPRCGWLQQRPLLARELLPLLLGLLPSLLVVRDGVGALVYARLTGGRFDQHGLLIHPDKDKVAFMDWLAARMPAGSLANVDASMKPSLWMSWSLRHPLRPVPAAGWLRRPDARYFLLDSRFANEEELGGLSLSYGAAVVGPFWAFDRLAPPGKLTGWALRRRGPRGFERYFLSGLHDLQWVEESPLHTWEVQDHFGVTAPPAEREAHDSDELRLLHNAALARGNAGAAAALSEQLLRDADRSVALKYSDGTELLGVTRERLTFRVWIRAAGPAPRPRRFRVFSRVSRRPVASLVPRDSQLREVGLESPIPQTRWKSGYIYCLSFDLLGRPGREDLLASFWGDDAPHAVGRIEPITLARAQ
jgi:hypothetical protein